VHPEAANVLLLTVPFRVRGQSGEIQVRCEPNSAPEHWGMEALELPMELTRVRGFPLLHARIAFEGAGYDCMMGWMQVLDIRSAASGDAYHLLDKIGAFADVDTPYNTFGYLPMLFDAPAIDAAPISIVAWRASAFLTVCPDVGMTRRVAYVAGFRRGFDIRKGVPTLAAPQLLERESRIREVPFLAEQCSSWEFIDDAS